MREVSYPSAAMRTAGAAPATPGTPWCSETQKRWNPSDSAALARAIVSRMAVAASPPAWRCERSRMERGRDDMALIQCTPGHERDLGFQAYRTPAQAPRSFDQ